MKRHEHLVWFISVPIIIGIVAVWAFNLKFVIGRIENEAAPSSLVQLLDDSYRETSASLKSARETIDSQLKKMNDMATQAISREDAINEVKSKLETITTAPQAQAAAPETKPQEPQAPANTNSTNQATKK